MLEVVMLWVVIMSMCIIWATTATPSGSEAYINPSIFGGKVQMYYTTAHAPPPEPINVILIGQDGDGGTLRISDEHLHQWAQAMGYETDCMGLHKGNYFYAKIDSFGEKVQQHQFRQVVGPRLFGSCLETLTGGNHFRAFRQNDTGAWFLGASVEENIFTHHTLVGDGYDRGRSQLVKSAQAGATRDGCWWQPAVVTIDSTFQDGLRDEILNHGITSDGNVAVIHYTSPLCSRSRSDTTSSELTYFQVALASQNPDIYQLERHVYD